MLSTSVEPVDYSHIDCDSNVVTLSRETRVILEFGTARLVWHTSRRKKWDWWRWARKVGSNGSGSWQKDASQNIVKGQVFLGPAATVHWHFQKKDGGATAKDRERESKRWERERGRKTVTGERVRALIHCHWGNLWCKITSGRDRSAVWVPRGLYTHFLISLWRWNSFVW